METDRDLYFFDLQGYIILRGALTGAEVTELNACRDAIPATPSACTRAGTTPANATSVSSWGFFRQPYRPTRERLARLTPERRKIVRPHQPVRRAPNLKPGFTELDLGYGECRGWNGIGG